MTTTDGNKSEPSPDKKNSLPWWWTIVIFGLVVFAYTTMYLQGIPVNPDTQFWALFVAGIGALLATLYQFTE